MALPQNTTGGGNGSWVKEKDIADAKAILFEIKSYRENVVKVGKYPGFQNILEADLTIFDNTALGGGEPTFIESALLTGAGTTREYGDKLGEARVARLILKPSQKGHDFYAPVGVDDAVFEKVVAYVEQRDAAFKALVEGDEPDWAA